MSEQGLHGSSPGRVHMRRWLHRTAAIALAVCLSASSAPGAECERVFSMPIEIGPGDLVEITGPCLPTDDVVFRQITTDVTWDGGLRLGPISETTIKFWDVEFVEPGRILVRVPAEARLGPIRPGSWNWSFSNRSVALFSNGEWWQTDDLTTVVGSIVERVEPATAAPGDVIAIHGKHMGADRSGPLPWSVLVGGKEADVLSSTPEVLTARLHPETPGGLLSVLIERPGAWGWWTHRSAAVLVSGTPARLGRMKRNSLRVRAGRRWPKTRFKKLRVRSAEYDDATGMLSLTAWQRRRTSTRTPDWEMFQLRLPLDVDARTAPYTIRREDLESPDDAIVAYYWFWATLGASRKRPPLPTGQDENWGVHIHSVDDRRIVGSVSAGGMDASFVIRRR